MFDLGDLLKSTGAANHVHYYNKAQCTRKFGLWNLAPSSVFIYLEIQSDM